MKFMYKKSGMRRGLKLAVFAFSVIAALAISVVAGAVISGQHAGKALDGGESAGPALRVSDTGRGGVAVADISDDFYDGQDYGLYDEDVRSLPLESADAEEPVNIKVTVDGRSYSLLTFSDSVAGALEEQDIVLDTDDVINGADLYSEPENGMDISVVRVSSKTRTEVETVPYETVYVWDADLMEGEYVTLNNGSDGKITRTYTLVYENGELVSEELTDKQVVPKVNKRVAYGSRSSFSNSRGERIDYTNCIKCYGTAYIPDARWGYQTYVGERARPGVIAVDPDVIPLGTKVYIECPYSDIGDYGYAIAWDVGTHVKGNWVDLFVENMNEVYRWGARDVNVYILEDQSIDIFALRSDYFVFMDK